MNRTGYSNYAQKPEGENLIDLTQKEKINLKKALNKALQDYQFTSEMKLIINIVYRRTIGYNKRWDDMNNKLFGKLTKMPETLCTGIANILIDQSILLVNDEEAHYGRLYAINYDFFQWGKTVVENGQVVSFPESLVQAPKPNEDDFNSAEILQTTLDTVANIQKNSNVTTPQTTEIPKKTTEENNKTAEILKAVANKAKSLHKTASETITTCQATEIPKEILPKTEQKPTPIVKTVQENVYFNPNVDPNPLPELAVNFSEVYGSISTDLKHLFQQQSIDLDSTSKNLLDHFILFILHNQNLKQTPETIVNNSAEKAMQNANVIPDSTEKQNAQPIPQAILNQTEMDKPKPFKRSITSREQDTEERKKAERLAREQRFREAKAEIDAEIERRGLFEEANKSKTPLRTADQKPQTQTQTTESNNLPQSVQTTTASVNAEKSNNPESMPIAEKPTDTATENKAKVELNYPSHFSDFEKNVCFKYLAVAFINEPDTQQLLLDSMISRLNIQETLGEIQSPLAYFKQMIRRYQQDKFIPEYAENYQDKQKQKQQQTQKQKTRYFNPNVKPVRSKAEQKEEAYHCYHQAAFFALKAKESLRDMAKQLCRDEFIESMGFDLDLTPEEVLGES